MEINFWGFNPEQLSPPARRVAEVLGHLPLASREQLAGALGWQAPQLVDPVRELVGHDLMTSVELGSGRSRPAGPPPGASGRSRQRTFLTGRPPPGMPREIDVCSSNAFPAVDALYEAALRYQALGKFPGVPGDRPSWPRRGRPVRERVDWCDVERDAGKAGRTLTRRFDGLYDHFLGLAREGQGPHGPASYSSWCRTGGSGRSWSRQPPIPRTNPWWPPTVSRTASSSTHPDQESPEIGFTRRPSAVPMEDGPGETDWGDPSGPSPIPRPFTGCSGPSPNSPECRSGLVGRPSGEAEGGKTAERCCRSLDELGLVDTVRDGNRLRYVLNSHGMDQLAAMERGTKGQLPD